jgi:WD40 repeat protein
MYAEKTSNFHKRIFKVVTRDLTLLPSPLEPFSLRTPPSTTIIAAAGDNYQSLSNSRELLLLQPVSIDYLNSTV